MAEDGEREEGGTPVYDIWQHNWGYTETEQKDATFLSAFAVAMMLALIVSSLVGRRQKVFPEACVILTVGLVLGFCCKAAYGLTRRRFFTRPLMGFDNALFFLGLLPPIIFQSGYDLHPRWLFGMFGPILWYALAGTFVSAVTIGSVLSVVASLGLVGANEDAKTVSFAETLTFGALISATDPVSVLAVFTELEVDPKMFYLVFGESVLNDAVGIVLFKTFSKYVGYSHSVSTLAIAALDFVVIFAGSMLLGLACAVVIAGALKVLRVSEPDHDDDLDFFDGGVASDDDDDVESNEMESLVPCGSSSTGTIVASRFGTVIDPNRGG